jgi:hypothetical protein
MSRKKHCGITAGAGGIRVAYLLARKHALIIWAVVWSVGFAATSAEPEKSVTYAGTEGSDLQQVIDSAPPGATVICDTKEQLELTTPLIIKKAVTLQGLNARLPKGLGKTSLIIVEAKGVTLTDLTLHGNYDSVDKSERAPLVWICYGNFRIEDCKFYDGSKDGVMVTPKRGYGDIVGGTIRNIEAFRMGRDAVSIAGTGEPSKVRDVTVENVSLKKGHRRGAVEVSDGTDNIKVRGVYAEDCVYAIDLQDHARLRPDPNTNIQIEDVTAVNCRHIIRTANTRRGHAGLVLRNLTGTGCNEPVRISNTKDVTIEDLKIIGKRKRGEPPISLKNCQNATISNVTVEPAVSADQLVKTKDCSEVKITELKKRKKGSSGKIVAGSRR